MTPSIDDVRALAAAHCNWGRWGDQDELGTLNNVTDADRAAACRAVGTGEVVSLSIPVDAQGPQHGGSGRLNPVHLMSVDGRDFCDPQSAEKDARRKYLQNADDILILPTQAGTQWDGLAHVFFEQRMWNGYSAAEVSSAGARRNAISAAADRVLGRGVLLDLPLALGVPALEPGHAISAQDLERACRHHEVEVGRGDFVLIRTGSMQRVKERGSWGDYAGGSAPGLGLASVPWLHTKDVAAVAIDTWAIEVMPPETDDVAVPVHILLIVRLGMWIGEIFDLEVLAERCAARQRYDFLFSAAPLVVTGGIGSPINPLAVL